MPHTDAHHPRELASPHTLADALGLSDALAAMRFAVDMPALQRLDGSGGLARSSSSRSPARRRARSLSPQRRSPKLRHTNGRLHVDPVAADAHDTPLGDVDGDGGGIVSHLLRENVSLLVMQQQSQLHRSHEAHLSHESRACRESSAFPSRKDVRRSTSCFDYSDEASVDDKTQTESATAWSQRTPSWPARTPTPRRFTIIYRDEALRQSCAKNTRRMIERARRLHQPTSPPPQAQAQPQRDDDNAATSPEGTSPGPPSSASPSSASLNQQLALKALRYRKLLDRMLEIDDSRLNDPSFDVLECLGVRWCKVQTS